MKLGDICIEQLEAVAGQGGPLLIVEVGCARDEICDDATEQRSTVRIAQWVRDRAGVDVFHSIDCSPDNVRIAREAVKKEVSSEQYVTFHQMQGRFGIRNVADQSSRAISFLLLDGAAEPEINLEEFLVALPMMAKNSRIVVDDCAGVSLANGVNKGKLIAEYCTAQGLTHSIIHNQALLVTL